MTNKNGTTFKVQQEPAYSLDIATLPIEGEAFPSQRKIFRETNGSLRSIYRHFNGTYIGSGAYNNPSRSSKEQQQLDLEFLSDIIRQENNERLDDKSLKVLYNYLSQGEMVSGDGKSFVNAIRTQHEYKGPITIWAVVAYDGELDSGKDEIPYAYGKNTHLCEGVSSFKELARQINQENIKQGKKDLEIEMGS